MSDLRRDTATNAAYLSSANIVNDVVTVHLGNKEIPDAVNLPLKGLPALDKLTDESDWMTRDFKPIQESGGKATALQIAVGYQNMQKG